MPIIVYICSLSKHEYEKSIIRCRVHTTTHTYIRTYVRTYVLSENIQIHTYVRTYVGIHTQLTWWGITYVCYQEYHVHMYLDRTYVRVRKYSLLSPMYLMYSTEVKTDEHLLTNQVPLSPIPIHTHVRMYIHTITDVRTYVRT